MKKRHQQLWSNRVKKVHTRQLKSTAVAQICGNILALFQLLACARRIHAARIIGAQLVGLKCRRKPAIRGRIFGLLGGSCYARSYLLRNSRPRAPRLSPVWRDAPFFREGRGSLIFLRCVRDRRAILILARWWRRRGWFFNPEKRFFGREDYVLVQNILMSLFSLRICNRRDMTFLNLFMFFE